MLSVQVLWRQVWIWPCDFTMFQHLHVLQFLKAMKARFLRRCLILKARRYSQPVLIILLSYGMWRVERCCKPWRDMKMRSFLANLTMKGIQLLQDQRIIRARYGEMRRLTERKNDDGLISSSLSYRNMSHYYPYVFKIKRNKINYQHNHKI